jgi:hypothetical protein
MAVEGLKTTLVPKVNALTTGYRWQIKPWRRSGDATDLYIVYRRMREY